MTKRKNRAVALAGQPNSGKSTIFNLLTGSRQHVANYPGVTVEVKRGNFRRGLEKIELIDLPGTYSLTSYSSEEMVTRDFILSREADLVVNVVDASNLKRSLYLTFQLLEMGTPLLVDLNMTDIASGRGLAVDGEALSRELGAPVATTVGNQRKGGRELREAIAAGSKPSAFRLDYGPLEPALEEATSLLRSLFDGGNLPFRWMAVKLFEADEAVRRKILARGEKGQELLDRVAALAESFEAAEDEDPQSHIGLVRHRRAEELQDLCTRRTAPAGRTLTDRIDTVVIHRFAGPLILLGVVYGLYELSIVQGYKLTEYVVPWLSRFQMAVEERLPLAGFWQDPLPRALVSDVVTSINSVLIYIPIFLILFAAIAVLEDVGYMPRMAFILDRLFRRFGLHGQSTLPLILGGVFVGGCAVPGVMATRVIADEKARLATILVVPLMNCMAKIPLYTLLVSVFFASHQGAMMVFISTVTLIVALAVAKVLTLTILRKHPSSPFVMEMPSYHVPTLFGVVQRSVERTWLFCRKILTVIALVAVAVFFLTHYPKLPAPAMEAFALRADEIRSSFLKAIEPTPYAAQLADEETFLKYLDVQERYRQARMAGMSDAAVKRKFAADPELFSLIQLRGDDGKTLDRAYKTLRRDRLTLIHDYSSARLDSSILGRMGQALEPVTRFAGFSWKVNVALLSSLAAKESSVATLGVIYRPQGDDDSRSLGARMREQETGFTPLHALALMLFMAFYPPCIATLLMVKVETHSWKWALFSLLYPIVLGLAAASLVFTGGRMLGLTGFPAAWAFYGLALAVTVLLGLLSPKEDAEYDDETVICAERR